MNNPKVFKWCAIDAEGDSGERGLLGCAVYSDVVQKYITDHDELKDVLTEHAQNGYTFLAHNASYDIPVIFYPLDIPIKMVYYNSRFNRGEWKWHKRKSACQIWDTLGLSGNLSLEALGRALNLPKYPTPQKLRGIDTDKYEWKCDIHDVWECENCYAVRDAEIAYRFMVEFTELLAGWGIKPRRKLAGIAMDLWHTLDPQEPIYIKYPPIDKLGRSAYYGGRVETFKLGHIQPAWSADVCSMYPAMMAQTAMPHPKHILYREYNDINTFDWNNEGVAEVTIIVPNMYLPPLPYRDGIEIKYPIGKLHGTWTLLELRHAQSIGCKVTEIHRAAYATEVVKPFDNFIGVLWTLRQEYEAKSDPRTLFAKLLMNNLYGRIGMKAQLEMRTLQRMERGTDTSDYPGADIYRVGEYAIVQEDKEQHYGNRWGNVLWAAQITSAARVYLHKLMMMQGSHIIYCDTDSVFSSAPIIGLGDGLGSLRDEQMLQWLYVARPKLYAYQTPDGKQIARAKGVPRKMAMQFIREGVVEYTTPVRPLEQRRRNQVAGTWIAVRKERQKIAHRRQPLKAVSALSEFEYTDTAPPIID